MTRQQIYKVVRRRSEPIEPEAHRALPPAPRAPGTGWAAKPAVDAYTLLALWKRAKMLGDRAAAHSLLEALERLAQRPPRSAGTQGRGRGPRRHR